MIANIITKINKCNAESIKTDNTVETVVFNLLDDERYKVESNRLHFHNKALDGDEVTNLAQKNMGDLNRDDCKFLYIVYSYFHFRFDVRNNKEFDIDIEDLAVYINNQLSLGVKNIRVKLEDMQNYIGVIDQSKVFKLFEIEQKQDRHIIKLDYLNIMILNSLEELGYRLV